MKAVFPLFFAALFVAIAILGSVAFIATGQWFGAIFFGGGFLAGAGAWFAAAAHARGIKLGSLPEAWRAVWGRRSDSSG